MNAFRTLILCWTFWILFAGVKGWMSIERYNQEDDDGSYCYTKTSQIGGMQKGEVRRVVKMCAEAECLDDGSIKITGCAPIHVEPGCYTITGNLAKSFPECCYEVVCKEIIEEII